ncbi:group III truncated hemoglobin [Xanthobacter sp. TB0139]|uniref:group III truncated hemoglobin n=1 Tax=Xanthobacter sp. TB0139 TaxID=3459178 RepID=UPI004039A0E6
MSMPDQAPNAEQAAPAQAESKAEQDIHALVHRFYDVVREDPLIGPVFTGHIADDAWPAHLATMCNFWSSVLLKSKRYDGRPLPAHLSLGTITDEQFARWLALFRPVARRTLPAPQAARAIVHAERMADSFRMSMAFQRGENITGMRPLPREDTSWSPPPAG